jgi:hypothetical protein
LIISIFNVPYATGSIQRERITAMTKPSQSLRTSQKWEYKSRTVVGTLSLQEINGFGMEGWEMCGIAHEERSGQIPATNTYYFKRPL